MSELNLRQERFLKAYLVCNNATKAAIKAGYSEKTAASQGGRLLQNVEIKAEINKRKKEAAAEVGFDLQQWLTQVKKIAFFNVKDLIAHANESGIVMKDWEKIDGTAFDGINEKPSRDGGTYKDIKFPDRMKALDILGKYAGIYSEKKDVTITAADDVFDRIRERRGKK